MEGFPENYAELKEMPILNGYIQCNPIHRTSLNDNIMDMGKRLVVVWGEGRLGKEAATAMNGQHEESSW